MRMRRPPTAISAPSCTSPSRCKRPATMMPTWVRWRFDTCLNLRSFILGGNLLVDKTNLPWAFPSADKPNKCGLGCLGGKQMLRRGLPIAAAVAPIATQAKVPEVVMAAGTSSITEASPFVVRTSFTLAQSAVPMAEWAVKNGIKKVVTLVTDFGPGIDAEKSFSEKFKADGGTIVDSLRVPLRSPDFSPVLQKAADTKPDALFVFVPSGQGAQFVKQFVERGLDKSGIKLIATGDVTDDDQLNGMGDVVIGVINTHNYSANHNSAANKAYVEAFKKANNGLRPNFMSVGGYDGMHLIYEALKKTNGATDGEKLLAAMKGMAWESPRGPISIDPETRDIIQNIYVRKVDKVDGELYNVEFATIPNVKDPVKAAKK